MSELVLLVSSCFSEYDGVEYREKAGDYTSAYTCCGNGNVADAGRSGDIYSQP